VLAALADAGLDRDTLVFCTTDHGISFPRHKCNVTDGGLEVMLVMRGPATAALPGGFGGACDALVSQVDVYPTLCRYLGLPPPDWLQGVDLLPVLRGERAEARDALFGEVTYHAAYEPQRCVRTDRYKLVRRYGDRARPVLSNLDDGPSKSYVVRHGFADRERPMEALYDLALDPLEREDRSAELPDVLADLRGRLDAWMRDTDDPLLAGPVPLPAGAVVNEPDDRSPKDIFAREGVK